jgi:hypothetical protein
MDQLRLSKSSRIIILLSAAAMCINCRNVGAPSPTATTLPPASLVHVFGRVVDFKTNAAVPNATIAFYIPPFDSTAARVAVDQFGSYSVELSPGRYNPRINGDTVDRNAGTITPVGTEYLAHYFVNGGDCVLFYGTVRDAATGRPISGATIQFIGTTQSATDGTYRFDLGCPVRSPGEFPFGFGTIFMTVSAPGYVNRQVYGNRRENLRGLQRIDVTLDAG